LAQGHAEEFNMRHKTLGLLAASTALIATSGAAQETYDLGTIVLSSSLSPVELGHTGTTVEVLTDVGTANDDISIINRLDRLPGVNSTANGGLGAGSSIRIRGLPARYVGVRINGMNVTDPSGTQNQYNFGGLTA